MKGTNPFPRLQHDWQKNKPRKSKIIPLVDQVFLSNLNWKHEGLSVTSDLATRKTNHKVTLRQGPRPRPRRNPMLRHLLPVIALLGLVVPSGAGEEKIPNVGTTRPSNAM